MSNTEFESGGHIGQLGPYVGKYLLVALIALGAVGFFAGWWRAILFMARDHLALAAAVCVPLALFGVVKLLDLVNGKK